MISELAQIQALDSSLLMDTYAKNSSDNSFQQYLDNEQKRLLLSFSPMSFFSFDAWFGYPENTSKKETSSMSKIFSDISLYQNNLTTSNQQNSTGQNENNQAVPTTIAAAATEPEKTMLQNLLQQTGWLTPNIQALPYFAQAQSQGALLESLDLQALVDKIVSQMQLVKDKGKTEIMLGLKPENLGEILLTLTSRSGMIAIQIEAQAETKKILDAELDRLVSALKKAKIKIEDIRIVAAEEVKHHV